MSGLRLHSVYISELQLQSLLIYLYWFYLVFWILEFLEMQSILRNVQYVQNFAYFLKSNFVSTTNNLRTWNSFTENAALLKTWISSATKVNAVWSKVICWFVSIYKTFHKKGQTKKHLKPFIS